MTAGWRAASPPQRCQSAKAAGGALKLSSLPRVVVQALSMCRLLPLFQVFGDDQEAIASFG